MKVFDGFLRLMIWWAGEEWDDTCTRWQVSVRVMRWLVKSVTLFMALMALWLLMKFGLLEALALLVSFVSTRA